MRKRKMIYFYPVILMLIIMLILILIIISNFSDPNIITPKRDGYFYVGADYEKIRLINNPNATNPTHDELINFIKMDKTDEIEYIEEVYTCGDYAETLHNNAEEAGIKAAWVSVDFYDDNESHALNAFETTDEGLVYVDCTMYDKLINSLNIGEKYQPLSLDNSIVASENDYYIETYAPMGTISNVEIYW